MRVDTHEQWWILHADGALRKSGIGIRLVIYSSIKEQVKQVVWLKFSTSNNEVEYEVMIVSLDLALVLAAKNVEIKSDSQLVIGQIQ